MTATSDGHVESTFTPYAYKMDSAGKIREWRAEVYGQCWRTHAGIRGGSIVVSDWTVSKAASQATDDLQAQFEAQAAWQNKIDRDYHPTLELAESGKPAMFQPMLAKDYAKVVTAKKPLKFPVKAQPKLDGLRCIITADWAKSRQNQEYLSIPHIREALQSFFDLYPDAVLDGELYNHNLKADFEQITSICRKKEGITPEDLANSKRLIQYHVYDVCAAGNHSERLSLFTEWMRENFNKRDLSSLWVVQTVNVGTQALLDQLHGEWVEAGYEGSMIRLPGPYENKRSGLLLKRKDFETAEFKVLGIESGNGNWSGAAKRFVIMVPGARVAGMPEDQCDAGTRGTFEHNAQVLRERDVYIGGTATVRYFGKTADGALRFPVVIDLHPEGRKD